MIKEVVMRIEWNGKKLTKKRALFLCQKLWEWLGKNPGKEKFEWPHWTYNGGKVSEMECACPCCEIAWDIDKGCPKCPLLSYWPKENPHYYGAIFGVLTQAPGLLPPKVLPIPQAAPRAHSKVSMSRHSGQYPCHRGIRYPSWHPRWA